MINRNKPVELDVNDDHDDGTWGFETDTKPDPINGYDGNIIYWQCPKCNSLNRHHIPVTGVVPTFVSEIYTCCSCKRDFVIKVELEYHVQARKMYATLMPKKSRDSNQ